MAEAIRKTLDSRHWTDDRIAHRTARRDPGPARPAPLRRGRSPTSSATPCGTAARPSRVRLRTAPRPRADRLIDRGRGQRTRHRAPRCCPHIFDRFYKADAARTRSAGSGLGLAITLENVRLHGGTIHAANRPGGGAVFAVEIPLHVEGNRRMRGARRRRRVSAFAVAAAVPLLGGCGIQETDVIEAGGPASVQAFFDREYEMLLFFRSPDGGLSPVIRTTKPSAGFGGEYDESGSEARTPVTRTPVTRRDRYRRRRSSWRCSPVRGRWTGPRAWAPPSPRPAPARPSRSAPPRAAGSRPACPSP